MLTPYPRVPFVESLGIGLSELKRRAAIPGMRSPLCLHRSFSVELRILREAPAEMVKESWTSQGMEERKSRIDASINLRRASPRQEGGKRFFTWWDWIGPAKW
jgi:hypothetical protein